MLILSICFIVISIVILGVSIYFYKNTHQINTEVDQENFQLSQKNNELISKNKELFVEVCDLDAKAKEKNYILDNICNSIEVQKKRLSEMSDSFSQLEKEKEENSKKAFENYCYLLNMNYENAEKEYNKSLELLNSSYENKQMDILQELYSITEELEKIKATRNAVIQAQLKEKEIKEQKEFYCLSIKETDLQDIKVLEKIKNQLNTPRILSMLIWSTYFQKPMTALCNNIIGKEVKSGIYKITNQLDSMCYIGQSLDLARRWKDHAKCGLGIDTPAANKLYKAMIEDGLWNFSFEILEECPKEELNEKERYYIQLYQSCEFGYNSNTGIK